MKGYVYVAIPGLNGGQVACWVQRARDFVGTLPAK